MKNPITKKTPYQEDLEKLRKEQKEKDRLIGLKTPKQKPTKPKKKKRLRSGEKLVDRVLIHLNKENDTDIYDYAIRLGERHKIEGDPSSGKWWKSVIRLMIKTDDYIQQRRGELLTQRQKSDQEWENWGFKK